jgi:hypothetical protein
MYYTFQLISCQLYLGTLPCWLGEIQAVTAHRPNSSSWVGSIVLIVKVMVGGGGGGTLALVELGPARGEMNLMNACVN